MRVTSRGLLDWLHEPSADRGVHLAGDDDSWGFVDYVTLADTAARVGGMLAEMGVGRDDPVVLLQGAGASFCASFFGCLLVGAVPAPIGPPTMFQSEEAYRGRVRELLDVGRPRAVLTTASLRSLVEAIGPEAHIGVVEDADTAVDVPPTPPGSFALLQFTSGSSGTARGVYVPVGALEANIHAMRRWVGMTADLATATWLPVYHDMGLIGCTLTPIVTGSDVWMLQPEQFVTRPLRWLRCFGEHGASFTATPNFGLSYVHRRVTPEELDSLGLDFGNWRAAIVGAERIDRDTIERFLSLVEPFGFDRRAVLPAYGLAEATLAVTGSRPDAEVRFLRLDGESLSIGRTVERVAPDSPDGRWLVGCGSPLEGVTVEVVDESGTPVPDETVGHIVVGGPSVASGYASGSRLPETTSFDSGRLHTGDAGFLAEGELFVLGRLGDSLKVHGKTLFAEELEAVLQPLAGLTPNRLCVLLGNLHGDPTVAVVVETSPEEVPEPLLARARALAGGMRLLVLTGDRGAIERTTSGKPRRRPMWQALSTELDGYTVAFDSGSRVPEAVATAD